MKYDAIILGSGQGGLPPGRKPGCEDVILDITMPNSDSLEATREIKKVAPNTKVLILPMHESDQMVRRVLEAGAQGYVLKSDLTGHLVKAVEQVSRGKTLLTPKVSEIALQGLVKPGSRAARPDDNASPPTPRQVEIIRLLAEGKSNKAVASTLGISVRTADTHRAEIMTRLGLHSLAELIHYAYRHEIIKRE